IRRARARDLQRRALDVEALADDDDVPRAEAVAREAGADRRRGRELQEVLALRRRQVRVAAVELGTHVLGEDGGRRRLGQRDDARRRLERRAARLLDERTHLAEELLRAAERVLVGRAGGTRGEERRDGGEEHGFHRAGSSPRSVTAS